MENPIFIDLDNLTPELVNSCLDKMGECSYMAPCIIGTLLTPGDRLTLDCENEDGNTSIEYYIEKGIVTAPEDQLEDIKYLQSCFDASDKEDLMLALAKYVNMEGENVS